MCIFMMLSMRLLISIWRLLILIGILLFNLFSTAVFLLIYVNCRALSDVFVAIVDDWNNIHAVPVGTEKAFNDLGYKILFGEVLGGGYDNQLQEVSPWGNGIYVAVVQKSNFTHN